MTEQQKLILAQMQVNNLLSLLQGNAYERFLYGKLIGVQYELNRQLTNLNHSIKMQESKAN